MTTDDRSDRSDRIARLRHFEWACARDEHAREVRAGVRQRSHDLMNLVQIVDLASRQLVARCGPGAAELAEDLIRAAADARREVAELHALAVTAAELAPRAPTRTLVSDGAAAIAWTADELELFLVAAELDAPGGVVVRTRALEDGPIVEIIAARVPPDALCTRIARSIVDAAGGEVTLDGGELVVAIRCL